MYMYILGGLENCYKCSITTEGCSGLEAGDSYIDSILLTNQTHLLYTGKVKSSLQ